MWSLSSQFKVSYIHSPSVRERSRLRAAPTGLVAYASLLLVQLLITSAVHGFTHVIWGQIAAFVIPGQRVHDVETSQTLFLLIDVDFLNFGDVFLIFGILGSFGPKHEEESVPQPLVEFFQEFFSLFEVIFVFAYTKCVIVGLFISKLAGMADLQEKEGNLLRVGSLVESFEATFQDRLFQQFFITSCTICDDDEVLRIGSLGIEFVPVVIDEELEAVPNVRFTWAELEVSTTILGQWYELRYYVWGSTSSSRK